MWSYNEVKTRLFRRSQRTSARDARSAKNRLLPRTIALLAIGENGRLMALGPQTLLLQIKMRDRVETSEFLLVRRNLGLFHLLHVGADRPRERRGTAAREAGLHPNYHRSTHTPLEDQNTGGT